MYHNFNVNRRVMCRANQNLAHENEDALRSLNQWSLRKNLVKVCLSNFNYTGHRLHERARSGRARWPNVKNGSLTNACFVLPFETVILILRRTRHLHVRGHSDEDLTKAEQRTLMVGTRWCNICWRVFHVAYFTYMAPFSANNGNEWLAKVCNSLVRLILQWRCVLRRRRVGTTPLVYQASLRLLPQQLHRLKSKRLI